MFTERGGREIVPPVILGDSDMSVLKQRVRGALVIWCATASIVAGALSFGLLQDFENRTWDWRVRFVASSSEHDPKIKLIMVDQTSLEHFARKESIYWPWPRSLYNPVLFFLQKAGAKGVAFDMLFTEHSIYGEDDKEFAQAVASTLPVVSAVALRSSGEDVDAKARQQFSERQTNTRISLVSGELPRYSAAALPIEDLLSRSAAFGNVTGVADNDGIFRRTRAGALWGDIPVLNLPFALWEATHPESKSGVLDGSNLVRFFGPEATYSTYSFHAIVASWLRISEGEQPIVPLEEFKDAYVIIGANAPGLLDVRAIPFPGNYPGAELNATILDNIIHNSFLREVPRALSICIALIVLGMATFASLLLPRFQIHAGIGLLSMWVIACFGVANLGWWMPMVVPFTGISVAILAAAIVQFQLEGRQHRFIRHAFRQYISPEVIERIVADPKMLQLGGERRTLTILFSDIQGFTGISERLAPDALVQFLNRFLSEMSDIILKAGGTLDKYQGDAVIAFWNAPLEVARHEQRAVDAALACQRRLRELAPEFERDFGVSVRMRVGIHTGSVSVGNFGSKQRFNYTMIGDAANVASRLEGVNKVFGTTIIVSENTGQGVSDGVSLRRLGAVKVVGRKEPITIFQPLDPISDGELVKLLPTYNDAVRLFEEKHFEDALREFQKLPGDSVSKVYRERIERERGLGSDAGPVWDVKEK